jgi:hypothetical protein
MKRVLFIAAVSFMLFNLTVSANDKALPEVKTEVPTQPIQPTTLKGIVSDKLTKETLAGAIITVNGQKVYTDLDGNFTLSTLFGEKCQLKISLISYKDQVLEINTNSTNTLKVDLEQR